MISAEDDTVRLPRPPVPAAAPARSRRALICTLCAGAALGGGAGAWLWSRPREVPVAEAVAPPVPPPRDPDPPLLDRARLFGHRALAPTVLSWSANPLVTVLDFPTLEQQGQAMNRAAALIEKASAPRDRVLDDTELAAVILADRRSPASWYFGHNYRLSDLRRLFTLMAGAGMAPNPSEAWVASQLAQAQARDPARDQAILTLVAEGPGVDAAIRDSVLLHELGHGQFFTLPFFAAHVLRVWDRGFTEGERAAVRRFLADDGYDTSQEELMANEAMAYLLYTPDLRFFDPARHLGWSAVRTDRLRALLREGAPAEP